MRVPVGPFSRMEHLLATRQAPQQLLLLFASAVLRRYGAPAGTSSLRKVENFSSDLADGEFFFAAISVVRPESLPSSNNAEKKHLQKSSPSKFKSTGGGDEVATSSKVQQQQQQLSPMTVAEFVAHPAAQRADIVCQCLERMGMPALVTSMDIVMGVHLRLLALTATLFSVFAASNLPDAVNVMMSKKKLERAEQSVVSIDSVERIAQGVVTGNRIWQRLSGLALRDVMGRLQNVRSAETDVLDERSRRFQNWFLQLDDERCGALVSANPFTATNELDRVSSALAASYWDLRAIYQRYAALSSTGNGAASVVTESGVLMTQEALLSLVKDSGVARELPRSALDEAYRFAAASTMTNAPQASHDGSSLHSPSEPVMVFVPTAVGAAKRSITPGIVAKRVTPFVFVHVLVHLAHQRAMLRANASQPPETAPEKQDATLHGSLQKLLLGDLTSGGGASLSSVADAFRRQLHHPAVARQFRSHDRSLARVFRLFAEAGSGNELMSVDGVVRCLKELRLLDPLSGGKSSSAATSTAVGLSSDQVNMTAIMLHWTDDVVTAQVSRNAKLVSHLDSVSTSAHHKLDVAKKAVAANKAIRDTAATDKSSSAGASPKKGKASAAAGRTPATTSLGDHADAKNAPSEDQPVPVPFQRFLDLLTFAASVRFASPVIPVAEKVRLMLNDPTFSSRLKELVK